MITILAPYFSPAVEAGGPIKSIGGVCSIIEEDCDYKVITRNHDIDGTLLDKKEYQDHVVYSSKVSIGLLRSYFKKSSLIWFNSLHSKPFSILPLISLFLIKKTTVLISPRGQLLYGAINNLKRMYLQVFSFLLRMTGHRVVIHYTHKDEKEKSYNVFKKYESVVFANPIPGNIHNKEITENNNTHFVIGFFGRITPKKNIGFIIDLLPQLDSSITLEIHGALEDKAYIQKLNEKIETLKISERVVFCGQYDKKSYVEKARGVDVIVVPSLSENFCHVFFEAIEMRKIVIASSGLPWEDANKLVPKTILSLDKEKWIHILEEVYALNEEEYSQQQDKLIAYYNQIKTSVEKETLENFKQLSKTHESK